MARVPQIKNLTLAVSRPTLLKGGDKTLADGRFCIRYRLDDPVLLASIKKFGILAPVIVQKTKTGSRVLSGHKRLYAARVLKLKQAPAVEIESSPAPCPVPCPPQADPSSGGQGERIKVRGRSYSNLSHSANVELSEKDAFLFALVSNWGQELPEMDRARAVAKAVRDFGFKPEELAGTLLPILGLPPDRKAAELYLEADALPDLIKDLVHDKKLPFRTCAALARLCPADCDIFARRIASAVKFTSSQCQQAVEWIADIVKRDGKGLAKILREPAFREVVHHRGMDPRTRADRFFAVLKRKRFPVYEARLEEFEKCAARVHPGGQFRIDPVAGFEEPGIELRVRLKNPRELARLLEKLAAERPALNSLFDFTL